MVAGIGRQLVEVPVGFKWFVDGLIGGHHRFRRRRVGGCVVPAPRRIGVDHRQGRHHPGVAGRRDPRRHRRDAVAALSGADRAYGAPTYARIDAPADREQKARLAKLSADQVTATELAGEQITAKLTTAPGNGAPLGGLKVTTANAWFAARPSGTEDVYKIYAESFRGPEHLAEVQQAAQEVVDKVIG